MPGTITRLFFALGLLLCTSAVSHACSCEGLPSHRKEFRSAKAVFVGRVLAIEKTLPVPEVLDGQVPEVAYAIRLEIEKMWKGAKTREVVVWLHTSSLSCARWQFQLNERYLVYAREHKHVLIVDTWCSRTRLFETNDAQSIRELKELESMRVKNSRP